MIEAAGGLLWRTSPRGLEIALVHRRRYEEWSLPKGKPLPGETVEATALREVLEETGFRARITSLAGTISYEVQGEPKQVVFWNMAPEEEVRDPRGEEIAEVKWSTPEAALELMTHQEQRDLVTRAWKGGQCHGDLAGG